MKSFLQTVSWLKFQEHIGHKVWRFESGPIKANIIQHKLPFFRSYLYIPHGPTINLEEIQHGLKNEIRTFMSQILAIARQEKAIFLKVEPISDAVMELIYRRGFKLSSKKVQPSRSIIVDLDKSEEDLLAGMHQKTRYNINLAVKKSITVQESHDINAFLHLLKKTAKDDNFRTHPESAYRKMMEFFSHGKELEMKLFIARQHHQPLAGALVLIYGRQAYYLHGAMDRDYKSMMAPYVLHWQIMKWLKSRNFDTYDFWGIDPHNWPGVTRFKMGWGGREVEYPGSFDLPVSGFWYFLYGIMRKIR